MIIQILILSILPLLLLSKEFIYSKKNENLKNERIDFHKLSKKDTECLIYYDSNVLPTYIDDKKVEFYEYLEYWWNTEETDDELLTKVCNYIYHRFLKRNLKLRVNKNRN